MTVPSGSFARISFLSSAARPILDRATELLGGIDAGAGLGRRIISVHLSGVDLAHLLRRESFGLGGLHFRETNAEDLADPDAAHLVVEGLVAAHAPLVAGHEHGLLIRDRRSAVRILGLDLVMEAADTGLEIVDLLLRSFLSGKPRVDFADIEKRAFEPVADLSPFDERRTNFVFRIEQRRVWLRQSRCCLL